MSKVMINMESLENVNGGKDFSDVVIDKVVDGLVAAKDGVVDGAKWVGTNVADGACWVGGKIADGAKWVGRTIFSWFH